MNLYKPLSCEIFCSKEQPFIIKSFKYYIWNNYKRKMIEVYGDLCSKTRPDDFINNINNEYLQSIIQEYKFTYQEHIYEKNNKIYQYNNQI